MKNRKKITSLILFLIILVTGVFWFKPEPELDEGMIIVTAVPATTDLINHDHGMAEKYISQARIIGIDPEKKDTEPLLFTEEFYSARSPEVSYDGTKLLFSAQKNKEDLWQIYIRDLVTFEINQLTASSENCTDPVWLPDGRVLYSRLDNELSGTQMHALHVIQTNGCCNERLTYHPESAISSSVTHDGRIVTLSRQIFPESGKKQYMTLRTDGTKAELFYSNDSDGYPTGRCWETTDGDIFFIERLTGKDSGNILVKVAFGHPLSSRKSISGTRELDLHSLYPYDKDHLIISGRPETETGQPFGLYLLDLTAEKSVRSVWSLKDYHLIEPVLVKDRPVPKRLPEIVDKSKDKGTLLCHDAGHSQINIDEKFNDTETDRIQILGLEGLLGEVEVEEDGSFYIKLDANEPVRFQTVNSQGDILRGPSSWIWVRPNEKRSCIGCHEDPELAPQNKVPEALYSGMVTIPEGKKAEPVVLSEKRRNKR